VYKQSKFTSIVNRLFLGLILTKVLISPVIKYTTEQSDGFVSTVHQGCLNSPLSCFQKDLIIEIQVVLEFIQEADINLTRPTLGKKTFNYSISIERILGYLIFLTLIWELPKAFYFYIVNPAKRLLKVKGDSTNVSPADIIGFKKLPLPSLVIIKQNPNRAKIAYSQIPIFPIKKGE
jgi:hypothetical protein